MHFEIPVKIQRQREICDLVSWHGLGQVERVLEVHRTTIQRWCQGKIDVPIAAIIALRALKGDFPHMELEGQKQWEGWTFGRDGSLFEPNGYAHTPSNISAYFWTYQIISSQDQRIKQLEAKLTAAGVRYAVQVPANETPVFDGPDRPANAFPYTDKKRRKRA